MADISYISVDGILPAAGDFITEVHDDFHYTIQIIERHRLYEPARGVYSWCLIFTDAEDCPHLDKLSTMMRDWPKDERLNRRIDLNRARQ